MAETHQPAGVGVSLPSEPAGVAAAPVRTVILSLIFFVSGFPALVYQLVWQRSLFSIYGINIESVTVVVSAFMLGLGLGSLIGGKISEGRRAPLLLLFSVVEFGIGLFGFFSLDLFRWAGTYTAGGSTLQTGVVTFLLVLVPTLFMGATLPLLVAHLVRRTGNVGRSVGLLYFANTIGSATACFAAAWWIMGALGMQGTVRLAVALNVVVGTSAAILSRWTRRPRGEQATLDSPEATTAPSPSGQNAQPSRQFPLAVALVAVTGFISLSYEILWVRVYSFATGGMAGAFAMLLGSYLLGIALGSLVARRFCRTTGASDHRQLRNLGVFVLAANLVGFAVVPAVAFLLQHVMYWWTLGVVVIAAAGLGASFPLICHFGIPPDDRAGARLSQLYLANIVGASAGSLATGFIFVSIWSLQGISTFLALFGLALAGGIFAMSGLQGRARVKAAGGMALAVAAVALSATPMFEHVHEKLQLKKHYKPGFEFARIHESRGGIVTIKKSGRVYGNGIYDGKLSTNLVKDINGIARVFSMSALHPAPKRVLEIGLSMGAWAQVIANHPQVEELTIIEIDEGYLDLIPHYPLVASVLDHPKVEIIIDDGRRWLQANPDARFDAIVMNTTFGWRAHSSGLLSVEFLELVRGHLAEGGFAQYNTTFSGRAYATGLKVFPHAVRIWNNLAVSDTPFDMDKRRWRSVLERYEIDGKPVFDLTKGRHRRRLDAVVRRLDGVSRRRGRKQYMEGRRSLMRRMGKRAVITDDNMGTEWGHAAALKSALKYSK